jgi:hypothetical protein
MSGQIISAFGYNVTQCEHTYIVLLQKEHFALSNPFGSVLDFGIMPRIISSVMLN